jgi:hypothetical protein
VIIAATCRNGSPPFRRVISPAAVASRLEFLGKKRYDACANQSVCVRTAGKLTVGRQNVFLAWCDRLVYLPDRLKS